jgi:hypothetical protein
LREKFGVCEKRRNPQDRDALQGYRALEKSFFSNL